MVAIVRVLVIECEHCLEGDFGRIRFALLHILSCALSIYACGVGSSHSGTPDILSDEANHLTVEMMDEALLRWPITS